MQDKLDYDKLNLCGRSESNSTVRVFEIFETFPGFSGRAKMSISGNLRHHVFPLQLLHIFDVGAMGRRDRDPQGSCFRLLECRQQLIEAIVRSR
jgi:hypothetical protein